MLTRTRPPAVAGSLYPGEPTALAEQVDRLLADAACGKTAAAAARDARALVVPHAAFRYSGAVAASAYTQLRARAGEIGRVVLLGPSHFFPLVGLAVPDVQAFETPLGSIPLDLDGLERCLSLPQVILQPLAHGREHSLEVQLPFLQRTLGSFSLVPLTVGRCRPAEVAEVLACVDRSDTLFVVSSDLSHALTYDEARLKDQETAAHILNLDVVGSENACGAAPVNGLLAFARKRGLQPQLLDLRSSGDAEGEDAGERDNVVGYAAIAFTAPPPAGG